MSEPKNHHYVPAVYLKKFADETEHVYIYNKRYKKYYQKHINAILYEKYFHAYIDEHGNRINDFEHKLNRQVETPYGDIVKKGLFKDIRAINSLSNST
jgi:hypothetical protein